MVYARPRCNRNSICKDQRIMIGLEENQILENRELYASMPSCRKHVYKTHYLGSIVTLNKARKAFELQQFEQRCMHTIIQVQNIQHIQSKIFVKLKNMLQSCLTQVHAGALIHAYHLRAAVIHIYKALLVLIVIKNKCF